MAHPLPRPGDAPRSAHSRRPGLREVSDLEAAFTNEILRLRDDLATHRNKTGGTGLASRPAWWWRGQLLDWVRVKARAEGHPPELVAGLADALSDFEDHQLLTYIECVTESADREG